jgi:hypothetical protein
MSKRFSKADLPDIIDKFNKNIKKIIKVLDSSIINNISYDTSKRRLSIVMKETPIILLQQGGAEIYNKREFIINNKLDDLLSKDISYFVKIDELNEINETQKEEVSNLFVLIKGCWFTFNIDEKKYVNRILQSLLSEYSKYKSIN